MLRGQKHSENADCTMPAMMQCWQTQFAIRKEEKKWRKIEHQHFGIFAANEMHLGLGVYSVQSYFFGRSIDHSRSVAAN